MHNDGIPLLLVPGREEVSVYTQASELCLHYHHVEVRSPFFLPMNLLSVHPLPNIWNGRRSLVFLRTQSVGIKMHDKFCF